MKITTTKVSTGYTIVFFRGTREELESLDKALGYKGSLVSLHDKDNPAKMTGEYTGNDLERWISVKG